MHDENWNDDEFEEYWDAYYQRSPISRLLGNRIAVAVVIVTIGAVGAVYIGATSTKTEKTKAPKNTRTSTSNSSTALPVSTLPSATETAPDTSTPPPAAATSSTSENTTAEPSSNTTTRTAETAPGSDPQPANSSAMTKSKYITLADAVCTSYRTDLLAAQSQAMQDGDWSAVASMSEQELQSLRAISKPTNDITQLDAWQNKLGEAVAALQNNDTSAASSLSNTGFGMAGSYGMKSCNRF